MGLVMHTELAALEIEHGVNSTFNFSLTFTTEIQETSHPKCSHISCCLFRRKSRGSVMPWNTDSLRIAEIVKKWKWMNLVHEWQVVEKCRSVGPPSQRADVMREKDFNPQGNLASSMTELVFPKNKIRMPTVKGFRALPFSKSLPDCSSYKHISRRLIPSKTPPNMLQNPRRLTLPPKTSPISFNPKVQISPAAIVAHRGPSEKLSIS